MSNTPNIDNGKSVYNETKAFIERFIAFENPAHPVVLTLWIMHTHAFDAAFTTPYMYVTSAEKQSGKTRTIEACAALARTPLMAANISASSIFRFIETTRPTLFVDEADTIFNGAKNEDLRSVLNSGYKHNGTTFRTVGGEPQSFSTFAPKLLAGIDNGELPDTIADRCMKINLKRKKGDVQIERWQVVKAEAEAEPLKEKLHTWAMHNLERIMALEVKPIDSLGDRAWDIAEPLVQIATVCGIAKEARKAIEQVQRKEETSLSPGAQILATARELFEQAGGDRIMSSTLAEACGYTGGKVGRMLAAYEVKPTTVRFSGGVVAKGYHKRDFQDAWERYLS